MRVKPYAMRSPSRNARHTALRAPGACMSTSGCSCRYRSSLGTWSGGPGGTSRTGQYRYPVSGQRNSFPKSHATPSRRRGCGYEVRALRPHGPAGAHDNPSTNFACEAAAKQHRNRPLRRMYHRTAGYRPSADQVRPAQMDAGRPALMLNSGCRIRTYLCAGLHITTVTIINSATRPSATVWSRRHNIKCRQRNVDSVICSERLMEGPRRMTGAASGYVCPAGDRGTKLSASSGPSWDIRAGNPCRHPAPGSTIHQ